MDKFQNRDARQTVKNEDGSAEMLEKFRKPLIHYLLSGLAENDKWVRYLAMEMLGAIRDPMTVGYLTPLLADGDGDIRAGAARAIDAIGSSRMAFTRLQKNGCDSCLIRIIAQEALSARNTGRTDAVQSPADEYPPVYGNSPGMMTDVDECTGSWDPEV